MGNSNLTSPSHCHLSHSCVIGTYVDDLSRLGTPQSQKHLTLSALHWPCHYGLNERKQWKKTVSLDTATLIW